MWPHRPPLRTRHKLHPPLGLAQNHLVQTICRSVCLSVVIALVPVMGSMTRQKQWVCELKSDAPTCVTSEGHFTLPSLFPSLHIN